MTYLVNAYIEKGFFNKPVLNSKTGQRWSCWCGCNKQIKDYFLIENETEDKEVIVEKLKLYFKNKALNENQENNLKLEDDITKEKDIEYHFRELYSIKPTII